MLLGGGAGLGAGILCILSNVRLGDRLLMSTLPRIATGLAVLLIGFGTTTRDALVPTRSDVSSSTREARRH